MITNRLDNKEILDLIDINKINKIFIDIDYTVLDFGKGNINGTKKLNEYYPGLGDEVNYIFELILKGKRSFDDMGDKEKKEHEEVMVDFKKIQNKILEKYPTKYWSRETMIMIAAKNLGLNINAEEVEKLRILYWQAIAEGEVFFEDVSAFLVKIKKEQIPIVWVTGSDSVLRVKEVEGKIELNYNPQYSWQEKEKRLKNLLKEYPGQLEIGDPVDKPAIWHDLLKGLDTEKTLVVGDSYDADLKVAEDLGMKTILISR